MCESTGRASLWPDSDLEPNLASPSWRCIGLFSTFWLRRTPRPCFPCRRCFLASFVFSLILSNARCTHVVKPSLRAEERRNGRNKNGEREEEKEKRKRYGVRRSRVVLVVDYRLPRVVFRRGASRLSISHIPSSSFIVVVSLAKSSAGSRQKDGTSYFIMK